MASTHAGAMPLEDYAREWLVTRLGRGGEPLRPRVRELYESELRLHILPELGKIPIGCLRLATVRAWYADLVRVGIDEEPGGAGRPVLRPEAASLHSDVASRLLDPGQ